MVPKSYERCGSAQIAMDRIVLYGESGSGDVLVLEVRQYFRQLAAPFAIRSRDRLRCRAGLPHAQKPYPVKALLGEPIQFGVRNVVECRRPAKFPR